MSCLLSRQVFSQNASSTVLLLALKMVVVQLLLKNSKRFFLLHSFAVNFQVYSHQRINDIDRWVPFVLLHADFEWQPPNQEAILAQWESKREIKMTIETRRRLFFLMSIIKELPKKTEFPTVHWLMPEIFPIPIIKGSNSSLGFKKFCLLKVGIHDFFIAKQQT